MALDSVDDQYQGCREAMAEMVKDNLLPQELQNTTIFGEAWSRLEESELSYCNDSLTQEQCAALLVYSDANVYEAFNHASHKGKDEYINGTYEWYALQFYLTVAVQTLNGNQNECMLTYHGTELSFTENVNVSEVRLGSFVSVSLNATAAQELGTIFCFQITTCHGAALANYSTDLNMTDVVIIPPYETFVVTDVSNKTDNPQLWCETVIVLNSTGVRSDLNCSLGLQAPGKSVALNLSDQCLWVASLCVFTLIHSVFFP